MPWYFVLKFALIITRDICQVPVLGNIVGHFAKSVNLSLINMTKFQNCKYVLAEIQKHKSIILRNCFFPNFTSLQKDINSVVVTIAFFALFSALHKTE